MREFEEATEFSEEEIDGVAGWTKIRDDQAWSGIAMGWETSNKKKWLTHTRGRDVVVQAGGCLGMYPRLFANHFHHVYTFEPVVLNFHCLTMNTQVENITKVQGVLGAHCSQVGMSNTGHTSNPGLGQVNLEPGRTLMLTIDSFNLRACDLIQLDVEGHEAAVLRGASNTLRLYRPTVSCERADHSVTDILFDLGYSIADVTYEDTIFTYK